MSKHYLTLDLEDLLGGQLSHLVNLGADNLVPGANEAAATALLAVVSPRSQGASAFGAI